MAKQTIVRLPEHLAEQAEAVARVRGTSVNQLIVDSLASEMERVRADKGFTGRARKLLERDKELLDGLAGDSVHARGLHRSAGDHAA